MGRFSKRLAVNAKVATALASIPTSSDTVESEGQQMKMIILKKLYILSVTKFYNLKCFIGLVWILKASGGNRVLRLSRPTKNIWFGIRRDTAILLRGLFTTFFYFLTALLRKVGLESRDFGQTGRNILRVIEGGNRTGQSGYRKDLYER